MAESNPINQPAHNENGARRPQFRRETPEYIARQQQPRGTSNEPAEKSWGRVVTEAAVSGTVRATAGEVATLGWHLLRDAVMGIVSGG